MGRLDGKVAIVTGGGGGLGRAIALALAKEGAAVSVTGRTVSTLEETVNAIGQLGKEAWAIQADIVKEADVNALVERVVRQHGRIDILFNNAATIIQKPTLEATTEEWRYVIDVNLTGTYLCAVAAGRNMVRARSGKIINISSAAGDEGRVNMLSYTVSKAAVMNLTRSLAVEWAPYGVYVNCIAPGHFDTEMATVLRDPILRERFLMEVPLRRIGQPHELGPLAVFLASNESDMITGEIIYVDGGRHAV